MNDIINAVRTREPLAVRAAIVGVIAAALHIAVGVGWLDTGQETAILGAVDAVAALIIVIWARRAVTPTADPRADDGTPLE